MIRNDQLSMYSGMEGLAMFVFMIWRVYDEFSFYTVVVSENGAFCQVLITFHWFDFGTFSLDVFERSEYIDINKCVYYSDWIFFS